VLFILIILIERRRRRRRTEGREGIGEELVVS